MVAVETERTSAGLFAGPFIGWWESFTSRKGEGVDEPREVCVVLDEHQGIGRFKVPRSELFRYLPSSCRYSPNMKMVRGYGAVVGAIVAAPTFFLVLFPFLGLVNAPLPAVIFGAMIGASLGFGVAPKVGPRPFWIVRRLWPPKDPEFYKQYNDETFFRVFDDTRRYLVPYERSSQSPAPQMPVGANGHASGQQNMDILTTGDSKTKGVLTGATSPSVGPQATSVHRASTVWHLLHAEDEKSELRGPRTTWEKIQTGTVMLLGFGTLGVLIFLILITSDPGPAAVS
jgi:hypothetical protein